MNRVTKRIIGWGTASILAASGAMINSFEGEYLFAYPDSASPMARALQRDGLWNQTLQGKPVPDRYQNLSGAPWTICSGKTRGVKQGDKATKEECQSYLEEEIITHHRIMRSCVTTPLALWEEASLTSFFYNFGGKACQYSITKAVNSGAPPEQWCPMMRMYNKAGGQEMRGLTIRRAVEEELCLGGGKWLKYPTMLIEFIIS